MNAETQAVNGAAHSGCGEVASQPSQPCCGGEGYSGATRVEPKPVNEALENNFTYHSPKPGQPEQYQRLREKAKELAYLITELCPQSRERSVAMTELETCVFWANAAIARNG